MSFTNNSSDDSDTDLGDVSCTTDALYPNCRRFSQESAIDADKENSMAVEDNDDDSNELTELHAAKHVDDIAPPPYEPSTNRSDTTFSMDQGSSLAVSQSLSRSRLQVSNSCNRYRNLPVLDAHFSPVTLNNRRKDN